MDTKENSNHHESNHSSNIQHRHIDMNHENSIARDHSHEVHHVDNQQENNYMDSHEDKNTSNIFQVAIQIFTSPFTPHPQLKNPRFRV